MFLQMQPRPRQWIYVTEKVTLQHLHTRDKTRFGEFFEADAISEQKNFHQQIRSIMQTRSEVCFFFLLRNIVDLTFKNILQNEALLLFIVCSDFI